MAIIDVIKYEGSNEVFVYKHTAEDFNTGSQLIVHESQEAVFFRDGKALDRFGAGKYTLDTEALPLMKGFFKKIADGPSQFHAEVYFINLATIMGVKWGTDSKVRMYDPASGLHLEIGAFGEFNIKISDSGKV
ncbi:MAG: SPFH domain-containing protein, partial [Clostridia bacterium]|nr:SPFH domain-containing protein [Clostridia bacterium]